MAKLMEEEGALIASNDVTGGKEKTLRIVESALMKGKSVVVDNTHVDKLSRKNYIELGIKYDAKVSIEFWIFHSIDYGYINRCELLSCRPLTITRNTTIFLEK